MARPKKQTIDYFPHYVNHHRTMFVLESKYGNDGYAFWFKLLEVLGNSQGMVYDCNNVSDWEFLLAKTHLNSETANKILDTLADLDAIDMELWQHKIVWSQNLVDNVRDAFKRRIAEMPIKPSLCMQKPPSSDISVDENRESKLKNIILKEIKEESNSPNPQQENIKKIMDFYKENFGARVVPAQVHMLLSFLDDGTEADLVIEALTISIKAQKWDLRYTEKILINWSNQGIKTLEQYKEHEARRQLGNKAGQATQNADKPNKNKISNDDIEAAITYIDMELTDYKLSNPTDTEIQEFLYRKQFDYQPEVKRKAFEHLNLMQYWRECNG
jgi:DnaD/phage-associated family protein